MWWRLKAIEKLASITFYFAESCCTNNLFVMLTNSSIANILESGFKSGRSRALRMGSYERSQAAEPKPFY